MSDTIPTARPADYAEAVIAKVNGTDADTEELLLLLGTTEAEFRADVEEARRMARETQLAADVASVRSELQGIRELLQRGSWGTTRRDTLDRVLPSTRKYLPIPPRTYCPPIRFFQRG